MNPRTLTIGVVARAEEHGVVREFFELFKTPWEFSRENTRYRVILHADPGNPCPPADLAIFYGSKQTLPGTTCEGATQPWDHEHIPLYGGSDTRDVVVTVTRCEGGAVARVGYDLFQEIRFLLTTGQPPAQAAIPTLERHIGLLRSLIIGGGIPLVEIPPAPAGHRFTVCLTHDLDHPSVRFHKLDHTTFGFLYRALVGSLVKVCRGQAPLSTLRRNVGAALRLPLVHLGLAEDFWATFRRYLEIERGLGSTFFAIPTKGDPGRTLDGPAPALRASAYGVADIADQVQALTAAGSEVGVHGIDAWVDGRRGSEEREAVSRVAGAPVAGIRMHWLFFDERAPERLDEAGFDYDSSFGYNDAVGFRAGTLQAFKPLSARQLLELPLHVMDTALFYPSRLSLTQTAAREMVWPLVDEAEKHGGALTINWHDRSIAPERLWDDFYLDLLGELKQRRPWFPTAAQAVSWFRRRRAARFESVCQDDGSVHVRVSADGLDEAPDLTVRVHTPGPGRQTPFTDLVLHDTLDARVAV